jgi:RNA polymerase sigma-70 factor (ECF subfamily)
MRETPSNQDSTPPDTNYVEIRDMLYCYFGGEQNRLVAFLLARDHDLSRDEAQDLVGELLLRLINRLVPLTPIRNLSAYIFRSLSNLLIDQKRQRKEFVPLEDMHDVESEAFSLLDLLPSNDTPDLEYEKKELRERLFEEIEALEPDQRAVIVANMLMGKTFEALSNEWNTPIGTLLARKHRAIRVLREKLCDFDPNSMQ